MQSALFAYTFEPKIWDFSRFLNDTHTKCVWKSNCNECVLNSILVGVIYMMALSYLGPPLGPLGGLPLINEVKEVRIHI